jgi:nitrate/nitrite transport system ATP-binding protein
LAKLCGAVERSVTAVMVTNSVDEAILLSDRIIPLSKGPAATLGPPIEVGLPRPRSASALAHDPVALAVEARIIEYLTGDGASRPEQAPVRSAYGAAAGPLAAELSEVQLG